ncbi:MAG TPA: SDR family NAD(P)-dependent oxidoreductase [Kofleriaceae bacterium]|jgi:NAD(P)-dependent dehydrogenase (short-subunit alcohol dehydrogenase family)
MTNPSQHPIPSGFSGTTTAREVLGDRRLDGWNVIVTGGYAGIGLETTRALANAGATVIVPARTREKARAALADLLEPRAGRPAVELADVDLANPATIDAFAKAFLASNRPLHLLINNAGIMAAPLARDARGFESQFATNHLGHFQLALRLWPALVAAKGARIVSLSSRGHHRAGVDFEDINFERREYDKWQAYGQAKTANVLFAVEADRRGSSQGIRAFAVHPGAVLSDLGRFMDPAEYTAAIERAKKIGMMKTTEQGASTSVWCATSPQLDGMGGLYCEDTDVSSIISPDEMASGSGVKPWALDPALAKRLWTESERWTGVAL